MPVLRLDDKRVLFVHVPKTGGTSVEAWMRTLGPPLDFFSQAAPDGFRVTPQHFTLADHLALNRSADWDYAFAIVRNPYERLLSEYHWRTNAEFEASGIWPSFSIWAERTMRATLASPTNWDNHIRPQFDFLGDGIDIYRYEDGLGNILKQVASKLDVPEPDEIQNLRQARARSGQRLNPRTLVMVNQFYAVDFDQLGYEVQGPVLTPFGES